MLDKSFGLLFYLKKRNNYVKGEIPIYLRITIDGSPKELSVKQLNEVVILPDGTPTQAGRQEQKKM